MLNTAERHIFLNLLIFTIIAMFSGNLQAEKKKKTVEKEISAGNKALLNVFLRMELGKAKAKNGKVLKNLVKKKKFIEYAVPFLAQYEREVKKSPLKSLVVVAPYLYMKKEDGRQLLKNIAEYRAAKGKNVFLKVPDLSNSNYNFGWACLEAGRSLMQLNRYNAALTVLDNVGRNTDDFSRVLAAEAGGDVLALQHQWLRADNFYKAALRYYQKWCSETYSRVKDELVNDAGPGIFATIEKVIVGRIKLKQKEAARLSEIEYYGPGYYLYLEAQTARLKLKDYRYAVVIYEEIIKNFEKTSFAEAAKCYRLLSLLELARLSAKEIAEAESGRLKELMNSSLIAISKDKSDSKSQNKHKNSKKKYTKASLKAKVKEISRQKKRIPWWPQRGGQNHNG